MADPTTQPTNVAMAVAASALQAQQARMRVIAQNLANADSTSQTPGGDPYRRQMPVFTPQTVSGGAKGVTMSRVP
jgi:flagellar basal-body rod protein FlgC